MSTPRWQSDIPSTIHGALAYLRAMDAQESGVDDQLDEWSAVYGSVEFGVDPAVIDQGVATGNPVAAFAALAGERRRTSR